MLSTAFDDALVDAFELVSVLIPYSRYRFYPCRLRPY